MEEQAVCKNVSQGTPAQAPRAPCYASLENIHHTNGHKNCHAPIHNEGRIELSLQSRMDDLLDKLGEL